MANNPRYHNWIFRKPADQNIKPRLQLAYVEGGEAHILIENRDTLQRHLEVRRRIEKLEEARTLRHNLTDLWE